MARREKKPVHRVEMTEGKRNIIRQLLQEYDIETAEDIYGFEASEGFISDVTDKIMPQIEEWQNRPLDEIYPVIFIDAIHYSVRDEGVIRKLAAYVMLGINLEGRKEVFYNSYAACITFTFQSFKADCRILDSLAQKIVNNRSVPIQN